MSAISPTRPFAVVPPHTTSAPALSTMSIVARFMVFLAIGLMVGAVMGYLLFPIEWGALLPEDTTQSRQLVVAVADKYWYTLDAVEAQNALRNMDPGELTQFMATILRETKNADTRTHIAALAQALDLYPDASPFADLVSHPLMLLALLASLVPIGAGVWLVLLPALHERRAEQERIQHELEAEEEENNAEFSGNADDLANGEGNGSTDETGQNQNGTPGEAGQANGGGEQSEPVVLPPLQQPVEEETEEEAEEHSEEEKNILKDLASLFEEEDTSLSALEAMVKNLPDIEIDDLSNRIRDAAQQLVNLFRGPNKPRRKD